MIPRLLLALVLLILPTAGCLSEDAYQATYSVQGEVAAPGVYDYQEDVTVFDAVVLSGVLPERSDLQRVSVRRRGANSRTFELDLERMIETGDSSQNVLVRPGDTILIPRKWR